MITDELLPNDGVYQIYQTLEGLSFKDKVTRNIYQDAKKLEGLVGDVGLNSINAAIINNYDSDYIKDFYKAAKRFKTRFKTLSAGKSLDGMFTEMYCDDVEVYSEVEGLINRLAKYSGAPVHQARSSIIEHLIIMTYSTYGNEKPLIDILNDAIQYFDEMPDQGNGLKYRCSFEMYALTSLSGAKDMAELTAHIKDHAMYNEALAAPLGDEQIQAAFVKGGLSTAYPRTILKNSLNKGLVDDGLWVWPEGFAELEPKHKHFIIRQFEHFNRKYHYVNWAAIEIYINEIYVTESILNKKKNDVEAVAEEEEDNDAKKETYDITKADIQNALAKANFFARYEYLKNTHGEEMLWYMVEKRMRGELKCDMDISFLAINKQAYYFYNSGRRAIYRCTSSLYHATLGFVIAILKAIATLLLEFPVTLIKNAYNNEGSKNLSYSFYCYKSLNILYYAGHKAVTNLHYAILCATVLFGLTMAVFAIVANFELAPLLSAASQIADFVSNSAIVRALKQGASMWKPHASGKVVLKKEFDGPLLMSILSFLFVFASCAGAIFDVMTSIEEYNDIHDRLGCVTVDKETRIQMIAGVITSAVIPVISIICANYKVLEAIVPGIDNDTFLYSSCGAMDVICVIAFVASCIIAHNIHEKAGVLTALWEAKYINLSSGSDKQLVELE